MHAPIRPLTISDLLLHPAQVRNDRISGNKRTVAARQTASESFFSRARRASGPRCRAVPQRRSHIVARGNQLSSTKSRNVGESCTHSFYTWLPRFRRIGLEWSPCPFPTFRTQSMMVRVQVGLLQLPPDQNAGIRKKMADFGHFGLGRLAVLHSSPSHSAGCSCGEVRQAIQRRLRTSIPRPRPGRGSITPRSNRDMPSPPGRNCGCQPAI